MDEAKFAADFLAKNLEKLWTIAKDAYGTADEIVKIKVKTAYKDYLTATSKKYSKAKSFFIRDRAVDLYDYYVPIGISCAETVIAEPSMSGCLRASNRLVITGTGGSGKSILMRHLFLDCMVSKNYVPILIELRDLNSENSSLNDCINNNLEKFGFNVSGSYVIRSFKAGHFCLFLDGFDEVNQDLRKKLIKEVLQIAHKYADCPIILSSRPDEVFGGLDDFTQFKITPLDLSSAKKLVRKLPFDEEVKTKFDKDLGSLFIRHRSFLSNPLLLSIMLLTYGEHAEIPSKISIFYNQAYETLFQRHDANKGGYSRRRLTDLDIQDFGKVFSIFSLQTYEKGLFKMSRQECLAFISKSLRGLKFDVDPENYMGDLLNAACLLIEDGLEVAYSHRSFQEYFVASYIANATSDIQEKLLNRYIDGRDSDSVFSLILEINPDIVERQILIPRLEKLFHKIGVKKSIGITHATRYMLGSYSRIVVDPEGVSATLKNVDGMTKIVHMAVRHGKCAPFATTSEYEELKQKLIEKFGNGVDRFEVSTEGMTFKTPVLVELLCGKGVFSIMYLQAAFDEYKRLKYKHDHAMQSLDTLLGI